jgi:hypothetical protein
VAEHTSKVFGQIQLLNKGFNEVQVLRSALLDTTIPFDEEMISEGIVRVDWNGPAVESRISALNDNFAREIDDIVRHPEMTGMGLYGQFMVITNGFNDTMGITCVTVCDGRVFVEKGEPAWTTPIRRI